MRQLKQCLYGTLFLLPLLASAQENANQKVEKKVVIELSNDEVFPEGLEQEIQELIEKEMKIIKEDMNGKKFVILNDVDMRIDGEGNGEEQIIKIMKEEDDQGNVTVKKFVNGKEVPVEEGENVFIFDSSDGAFPELQLEVEEIVKELSNKEGSLEELQDFILSKDNQCEDVRVIKEIDDDGNVITKTFVNGEEVEGADFPEMQFEFLEDMPFKGEDMKLIVIHQECFIDEITEADAAPSNLKRSQEPLQLEALTMYPNPNTGVFTLSFASDKKASVKILNAEGKTVYQEKLKPSDGMCTQEIDISREGKGMYFLNIEQKGKYVSKKIVVQ